MFEEYATFIHSMLLGICKHLADTLGVADSWVTVDQAHSIDQSPVLQCLNPKPHHYKSLDEVKHGLLYSKHGIFVI
jgi:hypothetical protein